MFISACGGSDGKEKKKFNFKVIYIFAVSYTGKPKGSHERLRNEFIVLWGLRLAWRHKEGLCSRTREPVVCYTLQSPFSLKIRLVLDLIQRDCKQRCYYKGSRRNERIYIFSSRSGLPSGSLVCPRFSRVAWLGFACSNAKKNKNRRKAIFNWAAKGLFFLRGGGGYTHSGYHKTLSATIACDRTSCETET